MSCKNAGFRVIKVITLHTRLIQICRVNQKSIAMKTTSYQMPLAKPVRNLSVISCFIILLAIFMMPSCVIVRPGETAIKTKWGKYRGEALDQGLHFFAPFSGTAIKFSTRITEYSEKMHLPTKEGLAINAQITLLYHMKPEAAQLIYSRFGKDYTTPLIINNLYAIVRQATTQYYAAEIITQREALEKIVTDNMTASVEPYGVVVDRALVKDILLPPDVEQAIANKVKAQTAAEQAEYEVQKQRVELEFKIEKQLKEADLAIATQKKEAERLQIEAEAVKKAQSTINESITDKTLEYKSLEVTKGLITSPNSKVFITNGTSPLLLSNIGD